MRVLIVDDDPGAAAMVARILRSRGHEAVIAPSPHDVARQIGAGERYDAILSDVLMPQMSGEQLRAAIAKISPAQAERFVLMSVDHDRDAPGVFLRKPFHVTELIETITRVAELSEDDADADA